MRSKLKPISVGWLEDDRCVDGGCWALFKSNGHLLLTAAQKGKHEQTFEHLFALALAYNATAQT